MSRTYDLFAGPFEVKYSDMALGYLNIATGEHILEVGLGTGNSLL